MKPPSFFYFLTFFLKRATRQQPRRGPASERSDWSAAARLAGRARPSSGPSPARNRPTARRPSMSKTQMSTMVVIVARVGEAAILPWQLLCNYPLCSLHCNSLTHNLRIFSPRNAEILETVIEVACDEAPCIWETLWASFNWCCWSPWQAQVRSRPQVSQLLHAVPGFNSYAVGSKLSESTICGRTFI